MLIKFEEIGYWAKYHFTNSHSGNAIIIGSLSSTGKLDGGAFTPKEAQYLNPTINNGRVIAENGEHAKEPCIVGGEYNVGSEGKSCILIRWLDEPKDSKNPYYYRVE